MFGLVLDQLRLGIVRRFRLGQSRIGLGGVSRISLGLGFRLVYYQFRQGQKNQFRLGLVGSGYGMVSTFSLGQINRISSGLVQVGLVGPVQVWVSMGSVQVGLVGSVQFRVSRISLGRQVSRSSFGQVSRTSLGQVCRTSLGWICTITLCRVCTIIQGWICRTYFEFGKCEIKACESKTYNLQNSSFCIKCKPLQFQFLNLYHIFTQPGRYLPCDKACQEGCI